MIRKIVAVWVCLAMLFGFVVIVDVVTDITQPVKAVTITVDDSGGAMYTKIQDAINASNDGDTVFVYNGTYYENVVVDKTINLTGEDRDTTIINGSGSGRVVEISANGVNVSNFTVTFGSGGIILLSSSSSCNISNNNVSYNVNIGISMGSSNGNIISNNSVQYNWFGITLDTSYDNEIINNNASLNSRFCISLSGSENNTIAGNNASNCDFGIVLQSYSMRNKILYNTVFSSSVDGIRLSESTFNNVSGNEFSWGNGGNGIRLNHANYNNVTNNVLIDDDYGIYLHNATGNNISHNTFLKNSRGIYLWLSDSNDIHYNKVSDNYAGVYLRESSHNNFSANTIIKNTQYGIYYEDSSCNNTFHHNNLLDNNLQVYFETPDCLDNIWDDGWGEGNFWSDYSGLDDGSGGRVAGDGIGDTEIPHPFSDQGGGYFQLDNYPFIDPIGNIILLYEGWNLISIPYIQSDSELANVLSSLNGHYDAVQWYDIEDKSDPWKHHRVGKPFGNDLFHLNESIGFWIHITNPGDTIFLYNGTQPTVNQSIPLHPGWNMVGYPSLYNRNRTAALNNINYGSDVDAIWTFNAATQTWQEIGPSDYFELGRGYWIHSKVTKVWDVPL